MYVFDTAMYAFDNMMYGLESAMYGICQKPKVSGVRLVDNLNFYFKFNFL